jgi:hypothetical protein
MRLGSLELGHYPRQHFGAVDQDLERTSLARLRLSGGPTARGRVERSEPANSPEPAPVVGAGGAAGRRSQLAVRAECEFVGDGS